MGRAEPVVQPAISNRWPVLFWAKGKGGETVRRYLILLVAMAIIMAVTAASALAISPRGASKACASPGAEQFVGKAPFECKAEAKAE